MSGVGEVVTENRGCRVIVVGAGVSGCTCAAVLAEAGVEVVLVGPALDHVCEPHFGPEVRSAGAGAERLFGAFSGAPEVVREAWTTAMLRSSDGSLSLVDRRLLSIRMKQALETLEALSLRQGLVVGLKVEPEYPGPRGRGKRAAVQIETAFGEVLEADAVVLAVGLGLSDPADQADACGSRDASGLGVTAGGGHGVADSRACGESSWDGLEASLREMGAALVSASTEVGPNYGGNRVGLGEADRHERVLRSNGSQVLSGRRVERVVLERASKAALAVGPDGPPSPYDEGELWASGAWTEAWESGSRFGVALPDGVVTGELALAPEYARRLQDDAEGRAVTVLGLGVVTRPERTVRGLVVTNACEAGRLVGHRGPVPVWVTGRGSGAKEYVESVEAGLATGRAVAQALLVERCGGSDDASL